MRLLKNGSYINAKDSDADTPLHYASKNGYDTIVDILLKNGADIDVQNNYGDSPYDYAEDGGHLVITNMLRP